MNQVGETEIPVMIEILKSDNGRYDRLMGLDIGNVQSPIGRPFDTSGIACNSKLSKSMGNTRPYICSSSLWLTKLDGSTYIFIEYTTDI